MEELWAGHCYCPKFQFHSHQTPEYVSAYKSQNIAIFHDTSVQSHDF